MLLLAVGLAFILGFTNTLLGLKKVSWRYASPTHVFDIALSTTLALLVFALLSPPLLSIQLPINLLINIGLLSFTGFVLSRYRERLLTGLASRWIRWRGRSSLIGERVLIVGAGDAAQLAIWLMEKSSLYSAFSIVGLVDDDFRKLKKNINGYPVLGTTREIPEIVKQKSIGLILLAITRLSDAERERILVTCKELQVRVVAIPDLLKVVNDYLSKQTQEGMENNA
jgi:FlaA1/EpsC-like NDP-sugar epimerase